MFMRMLTRWLIGIIAVMVAIRLAQLLGLPLRWPGIWQVVIFVPVLALANAVLGTVLRLLSLPLSCLTLGLFGFVVNALVFWEAGALTGATMNFWSALFGSVVVTLISSPLSAIVKG